MSIFEVIENSIQYKGRVFNVLKDKVKYPNEHIEIREVVEHSGGSVILGLLPDSKIVFIKQYRYPIDKFIFELPAGKLNRNEDPLECAKREFQEETGYKAEKWEKITSFYTSPGYTSELLHLFIAQNLTKGIQNLEPGEMHIKLETLDLQSAIEKILTGEINDGKTIIGILFYNFLSLNNKI